MVRLNLDLYELDVVVDYDVEPASEGGSHPHGGVEILPETIHITSVKAIRSKGGKIHEAELIDVLSQDEIDQIEERIKEERNL